MRQSRQKATRGDCLCLLSGFLRGKQARRNSSKLSIPERTPHKGSCATCWEASQMPHSLSLRSHHWPVQLLGPLALFRCTRTQKFFKQVACFSCTHTHTCISMHMDTSIHIHVHTCIYPHTYLHSIHTHTSTCLLKCVYVWMHVFAQMLHTHVGKNHHVYLHSYTYIYIHICIYINMPGYTLAFRKVAGAPETRGCLRQLALLFLVSAGA